MTQAAINYAKILYELAVPEDIILDIKKIFDEPTPLKRILEDPVVSYEEKDRVIDRIFPEEVHNFLKVLCRHGSMNEIYDIIEKFNMIVKEKNNVLTVELLYVSEPSEAQKDQIRAFLKEKYGYEHAQITLSEHKELLGGFILKVGHDEYDWSYLGRLKQLQQKLIRR